MLFRSITAAPPIINITSPYNKQSFTEPASVPIAISAVDTNMGGKITAVNIYNGATLLGTLTDSPYSFNWSNVPAGNYTLSAKAVSNSGLSSISSIVNVVVNIDNSAGFCGTLNSGDFSYRIQSKNGKVTIIFHPLTPITGCAYVYIYVRQGLSGGYPGYAMTAVGEDFTFSQTITDNTPVSVYFTYQVPAGGERNSSAIPFSYTAGSVCDALPVIVSNYTASLKSDGTVSIAWTTATELNNRHFILEKSIDGNTFNAIATVISNNSHSYSVIDIKPTEGTNYYRLVQIDNDGTKQVFGVKTVVVSSIKNGITVYPNPLNGTKFIINLGKTSSGKNEVQLLNSTGKVIYSGNYLATGKELEITLPSKPAEGIYLLRVKGYELMKVLVK